MTLTLSPEMEADLQMIAHQRGFSAEEALQQLVAEARAAAEHERQEALAGVLRSEADFAAGRSLSLEELDARLDARRQAFLDGGGKL